MGEILFCNKCGIANAPGSQFCSSCGTPMTPGAMAAAPPPTGTAPQAGSYAAAPAYQATRTGTGYGGFWIRVVAAIIDAIIVRVVISPITIMFGGMGWLAGMGSGAPRLGMAALGGGISVLAIIAAGWLYEAFMESSSYQATLGKMIFGMKVTDLQGNRISFARATGRHFAKILSGMILCIGFIMVGLTERKQGLHDMLAGTLVRRP